MVRGLLASPPAASEIVVSPRNADIARALAKEFPGVRIAEDNQDVVDSCDTVVLAIRPQIAEEVIDALRFRPGQSVISVIAATDRQTLLDCIGEDIRLTQAIPPPLCCPSQGSNGNLST